RSPACRLRSSRRSPRPHDYSNLITLRAFSDAGEMCVSGTVFSEKIQRIVSVNNFRVEFTPSGDLIYMINKDVPGVIGRVGMIMAEHGINIAEYNLARTQSGGKAMAVISIDSPPGDDAMSALRFIKAADEVKLVRL
ncbi:MAG TPA: ACT domain-containing protein, partial [Thermoanaerobaculia bacterium]